MADWDHDENSRRPQGARDERDWRGGRGWRGGHEEFGDAGQPNRFGVERPAPRREDHALSGPSYGADRGGRDIHRYRDERPASYEPGPQPYEPGGAPARGYGEGGDTSYGQMSSGSSASGLGGYGGAASGGWGQPNLNSQSGQGGFGPLNQGLDYGQDGGRFGPSGYDSGNFGAAAPSSGRGPPARGPSDQAVAGAHHDEHHVHYKSWRDARLASHDRDYSRWREEQARRYDEDYGSWRNERHATFSREFEGWREGRGGQATSAPSVGPAGSSRSGSDATVTPSERSIYGEASSSSSAATGGFAHGANPTLANIADGHEGHQHHPHRHEKTEERKDEPKS